MTKQWISVNNALPEKDGQYLTRYVFKKNEDYPFYAVLYYYACDETPHFQHEIGTHLKVTHWMPIPELQKDDKVIRRKCCSSCVWRDTVYDNEYNSYLLCICGKSDYLFKQTDCDDSCAYWEEE